MGGNNKLNLKSIGFRLFAILAVALAAIMLGLSYASAAGSAAADTTPTLATASTKADETAGAVTSESNGIITRATATPRLTSNKTAKTKAKATETATSKATAMPKATIGPKTTAAPAVKAPNYPEVRGVVSLTLGVMNARIPVDNDEYMVSQKKVDIYQRKLSTALNDKYVAENKEPPQPVFSVQRVAYERQRYTDWRNSELELERYKNDLKVKLDNIKSSLKKQYTEILDYEKSLRSYQDEMTKLNANIDQLSAQIKVGVAKASDMNAYNAQRIKLEADIAAKQRDLDLAKFKLKLDLRIDESKDISLAEYDEKYIKFDDSNITKAIKSSVEKCFSVYSNEKKLDILKDERAIMLQWDREGAMLTNLQNNEVSIKETQYALINAKNSQESSLWADYYSLLNQDDQIEIERLNLTIAESDYNVVTVKLRQGLVKPLDELVAKIALENAKTSLQTAINNYMRMSEDFQQRLAN